MVLGLVGLVGSVPVPGEMSLRCISAADPGGEERLSALGGFLIVRRVLGTERVCDSGVTTGE